MATITINGQEVPFSPGQTILQAALAHDVEIPYYCYHPALSIVASCRICLVEVWAPNPRNDNRLEPIPKLLPACQTQAQEGQVVYSNSPKAVANQKAVMEYLLVNHPLDCPVCDQAGECYLQDYSYAHGRGESRFEEAKIKQPKKQVGPDVLLYSDRCIMCSRCVRFTREVTGTAELCVEGRGANEQIDVFPGKTLDNELAGNVVDLCPVGALLDRQFLFARRVWELTSTPSIDPLTASGDNIWVDHADGRVYRVRPRENPDVNKWWITDEVRHGWRFVHSEARLTQPLKRVQGALAPCGLAAAVDALLESVEAARSAGGQLFCAVSPMVSCEDAFLLALACRAADPDAALALGPVPTQGVDHAYPPGKSVDDPDAFVVRAEKAPNRRGVWRVLEAVGGAAPLTFDELVAQLRGVDAPCALLLVGGYPSLWAPAALLELVRKRNVSTALVDVLASPLAEQVDALLPGATFAEKSGTFENAKGLLQSFEQAIPTPAGAHSELEIAATLLARTGPPAGAESTLDGLVEAVQAVSLGGAFPETLGPPVERVASGAIAGSAPPPGYRAAPTASTRPAASGQVLASLSLAAMIRQRMARFSPNLSAFETDVRHPAPAAPQCEAMSLVEL